MNNISQNRYMVSSFGGINVHERINDGQWSDMLNMTADEYPTAKTRAQRMKFENNFNDEKYSAMFPGKPVDAAVVDDKIFIACDTGVVAQGEHIADTGQEVKQIVPFGRDIFISPGGYLLKNDFSDLAPVQIYASIVCNTSFCNSESEDIDVKSADNAPENPKNGDYWFDTTKNGLYRYSKTDENWISVTQMYVKFTLNSEEENNFNFGLFKAGDAIEAERTDGQKNNFIVHTVAGTGSYMTVEGYIAPSENTEWVFMRRCPVFDFVCEHNNRIWGCRYGENDKGEFVNEIYASALGDPTNFFVFEGTAADSYIASVGHAGVWTGCISTEEYVFFFKRDAVFIVSGSSPATYTISKIGDIGVQKGSEKSLKEISGYVYYKSDHGVMRINPGGFPSLISLALGADTMNEAIAGTNGTKYYMSALENGERKMFVYDISLGVWTKEDEPTDNLCAFISYKNDLIAIGGKINSVCARAGVTFDEEKAEEAKPKPGDYSGELAYQRYILALAAWKLKVVITKLYARTEYMEARHILFELGKGTKYSDISQVQIEEVNAFSAKLKESLRFLKSKYVYCCDAEMVYVNADRKPEESALKQYYYTDYLENVFEVSSLLKTERGIKWTAETGIMGLNEPDFKRIKDIQIRIKSDTNSRFKTEIQTDESGKWTEIYRHIKGKTGTNRIVYSPADRIETFRLRFSGTGETVIYSITYKTEDAGNYAY